MSNNPIVIPVPTAKRTSVTGPVGEAVKWHPGHYVLSNGHDSDDFPFDAYLNEIENEPHIRGWQQLFRWVLVETARDTFDWSLLDSLVTRCSNRGLYVILQPKDTKFASTLASAEAWTNYFPTYLDTDYSPSGVFVRQISSTDYRASGAIWRAEIMDRYINMVDAIIQRYKNEAYFEGVQIGETSIAASADPLYSSAGYIAELRRLGDACVASVPSINYWIGTNFIDGQQDMVDLFVELEAARIGAGGPDAIVQNSYLDFTWGDSIFNGFEISQPDSTSGLYVSGSKSWSTSFIPSSRVDYSNSGIRDIHPNDPLPRDKTRAPVIPYNLAVQIPAGKEGTWTPAQLANSAINWKGATHMNWIRIPASQSSINWPNHILPYLQGTPLETVQAPPQTYDSVDTS